MTYFGFLLGFVGIPLVVLAAALWLARRSGRRLPDSLRGWPAAWVLAAHVLVALVYTTPWDNYLVATRVWWYDPELVTGIVLGWVPIEEYTFFIVQTLMSGLWLLLLAHYLPLDVSGPFAGTRLRRISVTVALLLWAVVTILFFTGYGPTTYLTLELGWALPPIALQLAYGADILWRYRKLVFWSIAVPTLYLSFADSLAIGSGTWTIDPEQSLNIYLGGVLPIEEFIFFLLTNTMLGFGMTLVLATASHERLENEIIPWFERRFRRGKGATR